MITPKNQTEKTASEMLPAAEAILDILRLNGVTTIFASPGSEWPAIWEILARPLPEGELPLRFINTRHESLAVAAAAGYHKATGKLAGVFLHSSVGPLQAAMPIQMADREQTPLIIFSGESVTWGEDAAPDPGPQWLRSLAERGGAARLMSPLVRWADMVPSHAALPGMVEQACRVAVSPPRGPAFLSIPMERMMGAIPGRLLPRRPVPRPRLLPDPSELERAAEALATANCPVIITEEAGRNPDNVTRLIELAELLGAPVAEAQMMSYLNFPADHPLHLGYHAHPLLRDADVVFLCAVRGAWHPASCGPDAATTIILADENPEKLHYPTWHYRVDVYTAGELDATLDGLIARLRGRQLDADAAAARSARWAKQHATQRTEWIRSARAVKGATPIDQRWAALALGEALPPDANIVQETTIPRIHLQRCLKHNTPGRYFARMTGGLGVGLSLACGVKVARQDEIVVAIVGDGALNYSPVMAALGFQQEHKAPVLTVVFNNQSYASMKGDIEKFYPLGWAVQTGVYHGTRISPPPDYAGLGPLFGGYGERVTNPRRIGAATRRAVDAVRTGKPTVLDLRIMQSTQRS